MCRYGICHIPALAPSLQPKNITFSIFSCRAARKGGWLLGPRQCSTATASQSPLRAPNGAIAWGSNRPSGPQQKLYVRFVAARNLVPCGEYQMFDVLRRIWWKMPSILLYKQCVYVFFENDPGWWTIYKVHQCSLRLLAELPYTASIR